MTRNDNLDGLDTEKKYDITKPVEIDLTFEEHVLLTGIYRTIINNPYFEENKFILSVKDNFCKLPERISAQIINFKTNFSISGILLVRNLPYDTALPPTPCDTNIEDDKKRITYFCEVSLTLFTSHLGEPYSFLQENNGNLYQNIIPTKTGKYSKSSESSSISLPLHTEDSFHPYRPHYIGLSCLKEDPLQQARTVFVHIDDIFKNGFLTQAQKLVLFENRFINKVAYSFGFGNDAALREPTCVCWGDKQHPFIKYNFLMEGIDSESKDALNALRESFESDLQQFTHLRNGDLMIINNRKILHGRTKYEPRLNNNDNRWLKRVFIIPKLPVAKNDVLPNQRIIRTNISDLL